MRVSFFGVVSLCVVLLWSSSASAFLRGDANGDATIDIADAVAVLGVLFVPGTSPLECPDIGDANDDGLFDISDGIYLLSFLFVPGSPAPAAPYPADGDDPTPDSLTPDCAPIGPTGPRGFVTHEGGQDSMAPAGDYLMFSQTELDDFWALHIVGTPPAGVDFANDIVVAIVRDFISPDHCCAITDLMDSGVEVEISYQWRHVGGPAPGGGVCPLLFTSPTPAYHIVIWEGAAGVSTDSFAIETEVLVCPLSGCP